jgi:hypothetical protein
VYSAAASHQTDRPVWQRDQSRSRVEEVCSVLHLPPVTDDDPPRLLDARQSAELAAELST